MDVEFDTDWASGDETPYVDQSDHNPDVEDDDVEFEASWDSGDETPNVEQSDHNPDVVDDDDRPVADETNAAATTTDEEGEATERKPKAKVIEPLYADVFEWVDKFFAQMIRRRINPEAGEGLAWDPRWWLYPEVIGRLAALHGAWEEARASDKPSAMSSWWIHHLEPHLRVIFDGETGPMALAKDDGSWTGFPEMGHPPAPPSVREMIMSKNSDPNAGN